MAHQTSLTDSAYHPDDPVPGAFVRDTDQKEVMVLLAHADEQAGDYEIPELAGKTVAEVNDCPDDDHVVEAAYTSALNYRLDEWTPEGVVEMHADGYLEDALVAVYSFPESRIEASATEGV